MSEGGARVGAHVIDVSALPTTAFGHRAVTWWATAAFILVEFTTLAILATSYLYLRVNSAEWPPRPASAPELLLPTINLVVILATIWPMRRADAAAKRFDAAAVRRWLVVGTAFAVAATVLRWWDFQALNVRWDTNAYGSIAWAILVAHTALLVTDVLETAAIAAIFLLGREEPKHFSDVEDAGLYQQFLSLSWLGLFVLVYLGPRVL